MQDHGPPPVIYNLYSINSGLHVHIKYYNVFMAFRALKNYCLNRIMLFIDTPIKYRFPVR